MQRKKLSWAMSAGLGVMTIMISTSVSAGGFDGTSNLVCAAIDVVACTEGTVCLQGQARTFDLPEFLAIDFKQKVVRATEEGGHKQVSPIKSVEQTGTQMILQGVENGHGWSMSIDRKTGRITTTVSGEEVGFMVFGACTAI